MTVTKLLQVSFGAGRLTGVIVLWLTVTLTGFWLFHAYGNTPGTMGTAVGHIPGEGLAQPANGGARLILFAHPHCPCTRATLAELAILLELNQSRVAAEVWFIRPTGMPAEWEQSSLWRTAAAIPGVRVFCDEGGNVARRLGAQTSGQVVLYDPEGKLMFRGGITRARSQAGDSTGRRAVLALLSGSAAVAEAPVFGCPLFAPGENCEMEKVPCQHCR